MRDTPPPSADHDEHVWTGTSPKTVHCALQGCSATPTKADVERLRAEIADARATRKTIDYHVSRS